MPFLRRSVQQVLRLQHIMQMVDGSTVSVDNIDVVGQDSGKYFPEKREMGTAQDNGAVAGYPFQGKKFSEIGLYHGSFKDESLRKLNQFWRSNHIHNMSGIHPGHQILEFDLPQGKGGRQDQNTLSAV